VRLLDLYCGAGGAAEGYRRAGFTTIVGVDKKAQTRYPFTFVEADAIEYVKEHGHEFDAIHASPPCQHHSDLAHRTKREYPELIVPTRDALITTGRPFVIENVDGAPLVDPVVLCGTQFPGLRVLRHRLFEAGNGLRLLGLPHPARDPLVHTHDKRKNHYGRTNEWLDYVQVTGGGNCTVAAAIDAMGIDWMTKDELNEAIPPAYTWWIGAQLYAHVSSLADHRPDLNRRAA
jgi:DNA (cytosine-5)-methyltransferase 1